MPRTHTSLPLDGVARNDLFIYMDMQYHAIYNVWIHFFLPPHTRGERRKTSCSELKSNPGALASQATALTTRPRALTRNMKSQSILTWYNNVLLIE